VDTRPLHYSHSKINHKEEWQSEFWRFWLRATRKLARLLAGTTCLQTSRCAQHSQTHGSHTKLFTQQTAQCSDMQPFWKHSAHACSSLIRFVTKQERLY
jgi:hypothetical protein